MVSTGPAGVCTTSSGYMLSLLAWWFCGSLNCRSRCVFESLACSWDSFPPAVLPCPALVWGVLLCLLYVLVFSCCLFEAWFFSEGRWRASESGKEGRWWGAVRVERGETEIGIIIRKKNLFQNTNKQNKNRNQNMTTWIVNGSKSSLKIWIWLFLYGRAVWIP